MKTRDSSSMRQRLIRLHETFMVVSYVCLIVGCQSRRDDLNDLPSQPEVAATNAKTVRRLLDQAIEAYGGMSAFEKLKMCKVTYQSRTFVKSFPTEAKSTLIEDWFKYPDKIRRAITTLDGAKILYASNGHNMWVQDDGKALSRPAPGPDDAWPPMVDRLYWLLQLKQDMRYIVLGDAETIGGQKLDCIVIMAAGQPVGRVYFDPLTHYVKKDVRYDVPDFRDPPTSLQNIVITETTFDDYKNFDGVFLATRSVATQDRQKLFELALSSIEFLKTIDDRLFDKPEEKRGEKRYKQLPDN